MAPVHDLWPLALMRERAGQAPPSVEVVRPSTHEEVAAALRSGRRVVPMGGASGVCGALAPDTGDLVLDLGALDRVEIDEANLLVRAGAGVNGLALERRLNERGLTLGHFPSSLPVTTVGGLVSTRSSGQESTRHGSIEDMLLGATVALDDGTVVEARAGHPRTAAGPPLHLLFVGAEGALGVVLEAVLRVRRRPEATVGRGWRLPDVRSGLDVLREAMQRDLRPLVLRLYDPADSAFQGLPDGGCLLVGATAGQRAVAEAEAAVLADVTAAAGGEPLGEAPWERWLAHRFDLSADRLRDFLRPPGAFLDTIELAATWTVLPALYEEARDHLADAGMALCHFSHAYAHGCCAYFTFAGSAPDEAAAESAYLRAWAGVMEITLRHGATISHHHGVGQLRAPWIAAELGGWAEVWSRVRMALDPAAGLNPNGMGGLSRPR
ncbi:MAG TPA: FAD-binding oxidoreductase [Candidatus Dormibacteraeota bacterium]|nr:FAD-binding oxidoreductase [Candidatus Dormibacteraeota bacterium]